MEKLYSCIQEGHTISLTAFLFFIVTLEIDVPTEIVDYFPEEISFALVQLPHLSSLPTINVDLRPLDQAAEDASRLILA